MEYHSDRFVDNSLLFMADGALEAILPANVQEGALHSHAGLTFGGIVTTTEMSAIRMLELFDLLRLYLRENNLTKLVYKAVPHIYHTVPAEEDLYALFRNGARLIRRDVSSAIRLPPNLKFKENRNRAIAKARKNKIVVERSSDYEAFMKVVEENLALRHGVKPVHSDQEMELLASRFPDNIKLYVAQKDSSILAGVIVYESKNVAHAQYIANTADGRSLGSLDLVFEYLIENYSKSKRYFDFGISTEKDGTYLNAGLISYKETYGARAVVHDVYELDARPD